MLVAALRSDNPLGGAPLTCDEAAEHFTLQGLGEITAAKLLDLENRRQLVWVDPVTREWVIETAAIRVRRAAAAKAAARADDFVRSAAGTLVFEPPASRSAAVRQPAGIRAAQTRFESPAGPAGGARRVVWSEPPGATPASRTATPASRTATPAPRTATPAPRTATPASKAVAPGPVAPDVVAMTTRRVDRRRSVKQAERRHALVPARLATAPAIVVLVLLAVLAVVVLLVVQHGGF
jgi:cobalamin biosynthesis Mg chelatase CobN